jgi:hypothetical protein
MSQSDVEAGEASMDRGGEASDGKKSRRRAHEVPQVISSSHIKRTTAYVDEISTLPFNMSMSLCYTLSHLAASNDRRYAAYQNLILLASRKQCIIAVSMGTSVQSRMLLRRLCLLSMVQGVEQRRQTFSKRKKGMVLKAAQLSLLTNSKVGLPRRQFLKGWLAALYQALHP